MYCPSCGSQISKYAPRCPECSAPVPKNLKDSVDEDTTAPGTSVPPVHVQRPSTARYVPPRLVGMWVIGLIMANIIILLLSVGLDFSMINYAQNTINGFPPPEDEFDAFWMRVIAESIIAGVAYICAAVMFLVWLHRTYSNLEPLGVRHFSFTSTWVIAWWFIPLMNYIRPVQVVGDIWKASDPNIQYGGDWRIGEGSRMVSFWWVTFVFSSVIGSLAAFNMGYDDPELMEAAGNLRLWSDIARIIGGFLLMTVVAGINERQTQKAAVTGVWPPIT